MDLRLTPPKEMGGSGRGTNPEQLFACGYSACFFGAMKFVAGKKKIVLPADASIEGAVGMGRFRAALACIKVSLPGMDRAAAQSLAEKAHRVYPYSNATRGNIEVTLTVV